MLTFSADISEDARNPIGILHMLTCEFQERRQICGSHVTIRDVREEASESVRNCLSGLGLIRITSQVQP